MIGWKFLYLIVSLGFLRVGFIKVFFYVDVNWLDFRDMLIIVDNVGNRLLIICIVSVVGIGFNIYDFLDIDLMRLDVCLIVKSLN